MNSNNNNIPPVQRALVLQGGGALGAYEVGALKAICDNLMGIAKCNEQEQLFDIVAGTSIGAMNAAVLLSNVINRKKKRKEAVEELEKFWIDEKDGLSSTPDFSKWWRNDGSDQNKAYTSDEALRKYYSVKEYFTHGTPRVCTALIPRADLKFGDQKDNLWICHTSQPLEDTSSNNDILADL